MLGAKHRIIWQFTLILKLGDLHSIKQDSLFTASEHDANALYAVSLFLCTPLPLLLKQPDRARVLSLPAEIYQMNILLFFILFGFALFWVLLSSNSEQKVIYCLNKD